MPANVERDLAREMFLRGDRLHSIAKQLGIPSSRVRQWAVRGSWEEERAKLPAPVVAPQVIAINEVAQQFTRRVIAQSDRLLMKLERIDPVTLRDVKDAVQALAALNSTGRKALGMDDGEGRGNTYQLFLASPPKPVIDIESSPILTPPDSGTDGGGEQPTGEQGDSPPPSSPLTTDTDLGAGI
jgi:hypothetical protein